MRKPGTTIRLETEERQKLEETTRTASYRAVQRARVILLAAEGMANTAIAREVGLSRATVVLWRQRFAKSRLEGLQDAPRPGQTPKYNKDTERRILAQLDAPPPEGRSSWTGKLMAKELGDVSSHQVWRVLRKHGIHLQRRRR